MSQRTVYCDRCGEPKTPSEGFGHDCEAKSVPMVKVEHGFHEDEATGDRYDDLAANVAALADDLAATRPGPTLSGEKEFGEYIESQLRALLGGDTTALDARLAEEREGLQNAIDAMVGEMHDLLNDCDQTNDPNAGVRVWAVREVLARYRVTTEQTDDTDWAQVAHNQQEMDEDAARIARAGGTP
jgi:hypothetical protein